MIRSTPVLFAALLLQLLHACTRGPTPVDDGVPAAAAPAASPTGQPDQPGQPGQPTSQPTSQPGQANSHGGGGEMIRGEVMETLATGKYLYVRVKTAGGDKWAAAPTTEVSVGQQVSFSNAMPMQDFESKTLGRVFKTVYFVQNLVVGGSGTASADDAPPPAHPPSEAGTANEAAPPQPTTAPPPMEPVAKAPGGHTVAEVIAQRATLKGKTLKVRGRVTRYNPQIMGKNWLHLSDGTQHGDKGDLVISTTAAVEIDQIVTFEGPLVVDRDLGHGMVYEAMLEDAKPVN